jgi:hypothetical protein
MGAGREPGAGLSPLVHVAGYVVAGVVLGRAVKLDGDVADAVEEGMIMGALRFVGLAILTAVAPIAVLLGSSPAHADTDIGQPCSPEGAKVWGNPGPIYCERKADGQLQWVSIDVSAMCVAFCVNHP